MFDKYINNTSWYQMESFHFKKGVSGKTWERINVIYFTKDEYLEQEYKL